MQADSIAGAPVFYQLKRLAIPMQVLLRMLLPYHLVQLFFSLI